MLFSIPFQRLIDGNLVDFPVTNFTLPDDTFVPQNSENFSNTRDVINYIDALISNSLWTTATFFLGSFTETVFPYFYEDIREILPLLRLEKNVVEIFPNTYNNSLYLNGVDVKSTFQFPYHEDPLRVPLSYIGCNGDYSRYNYPVVGAFYNNGFMSGQQLREDIYIPIWKDSYINDGVVNLPYIDFAGASYGKIEVFMLKIHIGSYRAGSSERYFSASLYLENGIISKALYNELQGNKIPTLGDDPYSPGGTSGGGGGGGSFDGTSDPVSQPSLPNIQLGDLGLFTMYNPSISQLRSFGSYLWSDNFSIDDFKKIFADPASAIIGMQMVPVHLTSGAIKSVTIGNIDSGVLMTSLASQWATHDCGTITIPEYWGAYLDYQPYTQMQLYLPYIGVVTVGANDLLSHAGKSLNLQYNVDALSGSCVATLKCGSSVLYHWQGNCGLQIPYTSLTYGNLLNSLVGIVGGGIQAATGNPIGGLMSAVTSGLNAFSEDIQKGGSISSAGGLMDIQVPYLIITRPSLCLPENQNTYIGYPSWVTVTLSELTGYTKVEDIHLTNIPATEQEMTEIESLLKTGVIM